jgi:hypothetical protein
LHPPRSGCCIDTVATVGGEAAAAAVATENALLLAGVFFFVGVVASVGAGVAAAFVFLAAAAFLAGRGAGEVAVALRFGAGLATFSSLMASVEERFAGVFTFCWDFGPILLRGRGFTQVVHKSKLQVRQP